MERTAVNQINQILRSKGQFVGVSWKSEVQPSAKFKSFKLEKRTHAVVRAGIDFANLKTVKDGIESGERGEVGTLPWGRWIMFPYLIEHKGTFYLRLYPSKNNIPSVQYFVNGTEVNKRNFADFLTPSSADKLLNPSGNEVECFTVKSQNIVDIKE